MSRPKSTTPIKERLNLSVSAQTKAELAYISHYKGISISQMLEDFAKREARKIAKATGTEVPNADQQTLDVE